MSEDQAKYNEYEQNISADAPKPDQEILNLWAIFESGRKAGYHSSQPDIVVEAEDEARGIMRGMAAEKFMSGMAGDVTSPMRSPEEVRGELKNAKTMMWPSKRHNKYQRGYINSLKWMLREEG